MNSRVAFNRMVEVVSQICANSPQTEKACRHVMNEQNSTSALVLFFP